MSEKQEWFATWFDSPYYHILYNDRDACEAEDFLKNLTAELHLDTRSKLLDLACGAGRHTIVLAKLGFDAAGCDLSPQSIAKAKAAAPELEFFVHDMRDPLTGKYDVILNLFTSFGYFEKLSENALALNNIHAALRDQGLLVIDFMNARRVCRELKKRQEVEKNGILFHLKKEVLNGRIVKSIAFEDNGRSYFFQEKVQALDFMDFQQLLGGAGFEIQRLFGNYNLDVYDEETSDRLIIVASKQL